MGASTLSLIKILMQDLYYQYTKNYCTELGGKAKMFLTDTNSLIYKIEAEFFYEDFYKDKQLFSSSNYSKDSIYYDNSNNLVVGETKDEA